tara:strand:- start:164 stop:346 length:183 start_codon:yes stop_codon:yes gene_type:complete
MGEKRMSDTNKQPTQNEGSKKWREPDIELIDEEWDKSREAHEDAVRDYQYQQLEEDENNY